MYEYSFLLRLMLRKDLNGCFMIIRDESNGESPEE